MLNAVCLDQYGNTITHLTQWDFNQKLIIELENYNLENAPMIHFCNKNSEKALAVQSTIEDEKIIADIPNILLKEPYRIIAYLYLYSNDSGKTIKTIDIPVRERVQPDDYEYEDNVEVVLLSELIQKVKDLNSDITDAEEERNSNEEIRIANENIRKATENVRISNENTRIDNENKRIEDDIDRENRTNAAITAANTATTNANNAATTANQAASNATATAAEILERADSGEFDGATGPQGPPGESGVVTPTNGFFTLAGDSDGNLWAYYNDADNPPEFEVDETGNIYYITPES